MEKVDCVVVGAGVIGLATARALALAGRDVIVIEANDCIGSETSSRNSEVIHAGIYYPAGSLKALFCVQGRKQLYDFCDERQLPYQRCGKFIIATDEKQTNQLQTIQKAALANGVEDIVAVDKLEIQHREPQLQCVAGLWSPSTGIIDSHSYMLALQGDIEDSGGTIVFNSKVTSGAKEGRLLKLEVQNGDSLFQLLAKTVVNCAGLGGDQLAHSIKGINKNSLPKYSYAKGNYFTYQGKTPFSSLIYPVPNDHGLGVHITLDMIGNMRFGPDVEWVDEINYDVDSARSDKFYSAIRAYWPNLPDKSILPAYSGIRPKINGKGLPTADFYIQGEKEHGVTGLINLFGIESPGLTSSLALADYVRDMLA
ncbi:MAG: L-2-hydroxyglutarate oxidase LhgO [Gammaproteobacteria bacterium]|jgi:L-2-hydroxyglutarate oxidase LhgO